MSRFSVLFRITIIVFLVEGLIMLALSMFGLLHTALFPTMDALALVLIASPIIYYWVINPYIAARDEAEELLEKNREELESRVEKRTRELQKEVIGHQRDVVKLRESEQRFRDVVESASDWIWETDANQRFTYLSDLYQEKTGIPPERILGHSRQELFGVSGVDAEKHESHFRNIDEHLPFKDFEFKWRHPGGTVKIIRSSGKPVFDGNGVFIGYRGTDTDITEHKQAEMALQESEQRYERLSELTSDGVIIQDGDRIIDVNTSFRRMCGYAYEELVGRSYLHLVAPESVETVKNKAATGSDEPYETVMARKDGSEFPVEVAPRNVVYHGERLRVASIRDITERKRMEHELAQSQKMRAVGQLTSGIAHDFNNLLTAVIGNLHMLREGPCDEAETAELIDDAIAAGKRGAELTHQLLAFSREQTLRPEPRNINDLVAGMIQLLNRTLGEDVRIDTTFAGDLRTVDIDPSALENAILNLALNARAAMSGGGTLTVATENVDLDGGTNGAAGQSPVGAYVALTISDTGRGMTPEVLERAFDPFFTTRDVGEGSGMGLSMVYGFAKQSGGHVTIDSEPGRGTSVRMFLPATEAPAAEEPDESGKPQVEIRGSGTVLVVEDDPSVRKTTVRSLKRLGYEVLEAGDGPAALEVLRRHGDVGLLFSDVVMPGGMNGIELAEEVGHRHNEVKVLLTSGYPTNDFDLEQSLEGRFELLRKPYNNVELSAAVKIAIEG